MEARKLVIGIIFAITVGLGMVTAVNAMTMGVDSQAQSQSQLAKLDR